MYSAHNTNYFSEHDHMIITDDMHNAVAYDGNTFKFGITLKNVNYIVKCAKDHDMSAYSEFIASSFINYLGIPCQKVEWGWYKEEFVVLVRDFSNDYSGFLHSFKDTKQTSEDTDLGSKKYTYSDVTHLIQEHLKMSKENKKQALIQFWDMFICDAILANRDRHWGNWGYMVSISGEYNIAPIYDNGACLFPGVYQVINEYINPMTRKDFMYQRIFTFPASLFQIEKPDRTYRSNYFDICCNCDKFPLFKERLQKMAATFSIDMIISCMQQIVCELPLEDAYKRFYIEIVALRYYCMVLKSDFEPAYQEVEHKLEELVL